MSNLNETDVAQTPYNMREHLPLVKASENCVIKKFLDQPAYPDLLVRVFYVPINIITYAANFMNEE